MSISAFDILLPYNIYEIHVYTCDTCNKIVVKVNIYHNSRMCLNGLQFNCNKFLYLLLCIQY